MLTETANRVLLNLKKDKDCKDLDKRHLKEAMCQHVEQMLFKDYDNVTVQQFLDKNSLLKLMKDCREFKLTPYQQALYDLCNDFSVDIQIELTTEKSCNFITDILTNSSKSNCDMLFSISVRENLKNNCNNYILSLSEEQCIFAYNTLIKESKNCELTYQNYKDLLELNYTPKCISNIYNNNFIIDPSKPDCIIDKNNRTISLKEELCFTKVFTKNITDLDECLKKEFTSYDEQ